MPTKLRAVHTLTTADLVQLEDQPVFYSVDAVSRSHDDADARCKVSLKSLDGATATTLVRAGLEMIATVVRPGTRLGPVEGARGT
jgi:hypothetical protein